ncbi:hypothetical protein EUGRSUZ_L03037 [Eucalyptus grandis]|uniref:Uncharacterized protein n=1 Tax=Eucalyptus grandis TaxID=71139 RepID=A0AAD9WIK6_EUCGR|nr:hypothetical protein EUGRSUZ_L03037 [Eucalyptus grandis]
MELLSYLIFSRHMLNGSNKNDVKLSSDSLQLRSRLEPTTRALESFGMQSFTCRKKKRVGSSVREGKKYPYFFALTFGPSFPNNIGFFEIFFFFDKQF